MPDTSQPAARPNSFASQEDSANELSLPVCQHRWIGRMSYDDARQLQESLALQIAAGEIPPTLLLLEHPHTYTLGRRSQEKNLLWDAETLRQRRVSAHWIDRGSRAFLEQVVQVVPGKGACHAPPPPVSISSSAASQRCGPKSPSGKLTTAPLIPRRNPGTTGSKRGRP